MNIQMLPVSLLFSVFGLTLYGCTESSGAVSGQIHPSAAAGAGTSGAGHGWRNDPVNAGRSSESTLKSSGRRERELPAAPGWYEIPNTRMESVCPPNDYGGSGYPFQDACRNVVAAWGGGVADTKRDRLIVWGGGHTDYSGNEVYAFDLRSLTVHRLTNPALPLARGCAETLPGPSPNSRHSYDGLAYIPQSDVMLSFSGSLGPTGCASKAAWKLSLSNLAWTPLSPLGPSPVYDGGVPAVAYDPNSNLLFISTQSYGTFASYNHATNAYTILNRRATTDYHETAAIDSKRKLFFLFGGGFAYKIDISGRDHNYSLEAVQAVGCNFVKSVYPGVAFDSSQNLIVGWAGGGTVELYNPDKDSCTSVTHANGPGPQQANGTHGRFQYFPALNIFVLLNSFSQNAYVLRLAPGAHAPEKLSPSPDNAGTSAVSVPSARAGETGPGAAASGQNATKRAESAGAAASPSRPAADADFKARCQTPGVIKCVGWDDPAEFVPARGGGGYADGLYPASDGTFQGTMDTSVKTSGMGSLKFTIRPNATANATGYWRANFGPLSNLTSFGPHTTLYLQFRLRLDPKLLNFAWNQVGDTGWKVFIAYGPIPGPSCTGAQFVQENSYQTNVATAYTSCGAPALYSNGGLPPMLIEQGDYKCSYNHDEGYRSNSNCFTYPANTWITEYWVVQIGDWGQLNTHFTAYIAPEGKPLRRFIDLPNFSFNKGAEAGDALQTILLQPYLSGADGSRPNPTANMWFDELIISTQPIAAPKY